MVEKNQHHLLFCKRIWTDKPTAKKLRDSDYCKVLLPVQLHKDLHAHITIDGGVPRPEGDDCRRVIEAIEAAVKADRIDVKADNPVRRLEFLINIISFYTDRQDTAEILAMQRDFLLDAYRKGRL